VADRVDFYFRQRVTEAELDLGFELLEKADRALASDIGVHGVVSGAVPSQHAPIADLTIDLSAPGRAYDRLGQRIFFGTGQRVDLAVDLTGIPTEVSVAGQERWLGVFLRFKRLLSDPRTDGNSQQVFFRRDESFELVVRQGPEGPVGAAPKVALSDGELLLCDVRRKAEQTQVLDGDIDTARRQAFLFSPGNAVAVVAGLWKVLSKAAGTVQSALDSVDALLAGHLGGTANRHQAQDVDYVPHGFIASNNAKTALDELIDKLSSSVPGGAGAMRVGADAIVGTPHALPASNVDAQLFQLLGWLNAHEGAAAGAHAASAIAATPHAFVASTSVQAQLQELAADLGASVAGQGAALLGSQALGGSPRSVTATKLRDQLLALLNHINAHLASGDHDGRYLRRIFSDARVVPSGTTQLIGTLSGAPDLITVAYNLLDAGDQPVQPQYYHGPYWLSIQAYVDKMAAGGPRLYVRNGAGVKLYITSNAYVN
jgi:hypothetical protein